MGRAVQVALMLTALGPVAVCSVYAGQTEQLTNADVIELHELGFSGPTLTDCQGKSGDR